MSYRKSLTYSVLSILTIALSGLLTVIFAGDDKDVVAVAVAGQDQEQNNDTTFVELHLSPDGVYGIDSSGTEWEYDFTRDKFINEESGVSISKTITVFNKDSRTDRLEQLQKLEELENLKGLSAEEVKRVTEEVAAMKENMDFIDKRFKGLQLRSVTVEEGEFVNGSIEAIGEVTVLGVVSGDVISFSRITVGSTGMIQGDARAPEIVKMRGGTILGERYETDLPAAPSLPDVQFLRKTSYSALWVILIIFVSLLFFALVAVGVISRPIGRMKNCMEQHFAKSFFIGFGGWFALGPLMGILVLTIIGIPVAIFVLPLSLVGGIILGIISMSQLVGQWSGKYFGRDHDTQLKQIVPGLVILYIPWILMALFMISSSNVSEGFAILFRVISIVVWSFIISAGIGAAVLTRFGSRDYQKRVPSQVTVKVHMQPAPPPPSPPPLKPDDEESNQ